jgi:periplasmic protein TonB
VAYRTDISKRDRGGALAAVVVVHVALLFALLHLSGNLDIPSAQSVMRVFDLAPPAPPPALPPPPPPQQQRPQPKPRERPGGSPPNFKSEATPIKAPTPVVIMPSLPQIAASETPRQGTEPTQGAATTPGPGTGAGGSGNGTGNGSGGGAGGGGDNGVAQAPRLVSPVLTGRQIPRDLLDQWPHRATLFLRLKVDARGFVSECAVDRGTGVSAIDSVMCNLAHDRLRFRPALNRSGQAVAGWFGYAQPAPR